MKTRPKRNLNYLSHSVKGSARARARKVEGDTGNAQKKRTRNMRTLERLSHSQTVQIPAGIGLLEKEKSRRQDRRRQ